MTGHTRTRSTTLDWSCMIPPDARVVLMVSCGDLERSDSTRRKNPTTFVVGIESDPGSIQEASSHVDRLIVSPPGSLSGPLAHLAPGSIDCLMLGVRLDSCPCPGRLLSEASRLIAGDGLVLAVVGGDQSDLGRWCLAFQSAGMDLIDFERCVGCSPPFDDSPHHRPAGERSRSGDGDVMLLRGVPTGANLHRLWIQTLAATRICSRVRTEEPDAALRTIPGVRTRTDFAHTPEVGPRPGVHRILIRQRNILGPRDLASQRAMREAGYLIVGEWDDDPAIFPEIARTGHLTFRACHCVQTSTEPLARVLRDYHPHVRAFPNQLAELPPPRTQRDDGPLSIVFAALNREADWPEILPGLSRVLDESGGAVRLLVLHDRAFFDAVPSDAKSFHPFLPYDQYVAALRLSDIALLPLSPSRFNRCKSDLKYLECAANGVVCLASPTVYDGSIRHGETGLIYRSAAEFEALLRRLVVDPVLRASLALAAYRDVARHRMLGGSFRDRYRWYVEMSRRLPELDQALCERVPELA